MITQPNRPPSATAEPTVSLGDARVGSGGHLLAGPPAELRMTIHIKRAATGLTETFELIGHAEKDQDGSNT